MKALKIKKTYFILIASAAIAVLVFYFDMLASMGPCSYIADFDKYTPQCFVEWKIRPIGIYAFFIFLTALVSVFAREKTIAEWRAIALHAFFWSAFAAFFFSYVLISNFPNYWTYDRIYIFFGGGSFLLSFVSLVALSFFGAKESENSSL